VIKLFHATDGKTKLGKRNFDYALHAAAYTNNKRLVKYLIQAGDQINDFTEKYGSPLAAAIYKEHSRMIDLLLKIGAKINMSIRAFDSALHLTYL
jgi:ankyrin repeat protein